MATENTQGRTATPVSDRRQYLAGLDAAQLVDLLDFHHDSPDSPHRALYAETFEAILSRQGQAAVHFAALLDEVDSATGVEIAMRQAGFVVGFEVCRQLMLGELDLTQLKERAE